MLLPHPMLRRPESPPSYTWSMATMRTEVGTDPHETITPACPYIEPVCTASHITLLSDADSSPPSTGEVASCMSLTLGIPMALTGHSLGRNKREHLLKGGAMTGTEIEAVYRMSR